MNKWIEIEKEYTNEGIKLIVSCKRAKIHHSVFVSWEEKLNEIIEGLENKIEVEVLGKKLSLDDIKIDLLCCRDKDLNRFQLFTYLPLNISVKEGHSYSSVTYQMADQIITLYEGNRQLQINDGADPEKCIIIPNGIELKNRTITPKEGLSGKDKIVVALVGRVVQIKDVKTFIQAAKTIISKDFRVECWVIGPTDEEPEYFGDCVVMQTLLDLSDKLIFSLSFFSSFLFTRFSSSSDICRESDSDG